MYFNHFMPDDDSLKGLDFATKKEIMQLVCSRMSYEGDMGGSGAAMDPLFWVAHGAVDRLFQRVMFADVFTDNIYKNQGETSALVLPAMHTLSGYACPVMPLYSHHCFVARCPQGAGASAQATTPKGRSIGWTA